MKKTKTNRFAPTRYTTEQTASYNFGLRRAGKYVAAPAVLTSEEKILDAYRADTAEGGRLAKAVKFAFVTGNNTLGRDKDATLALVNKVLSFERKPLCGIA